VVSTRLYFQVGGPNEELPSQVSVCYIVSLLLAGYWAVIGLPIAVSIMAGVTRGMAG
jgi:hypothetical protein